MMLHTVDFGQTTRIPLKEWFDKQKANTNNDE